MWDWHNLWERKESINDIFLGEKKKKKEKIKNWGERAKRHN